MKDMINTYLDKLIDDIRCYSRPDSKNNGDRIKLCADKIIELLEWRDKMEFIGSDEVFNMGDLQGTDRLHKFYLY